jgi:hypothetical protein
MTNMLRCRDLTQFSMSVRILASTFFLIFAELASELEAPADPTTVTRQTVYRPESINH